jgi:hypothetical protein
MRMLETLARIEAALELEGQDIGVKLKDGGRHAV